MKKIVSSYLLGKIEVFLISDGYSSGIIMLPKGLKPVLSDSLKRNIEPMIQMKLVGDAYPGAFGNGRTMHNSDSAMQMRLVGQNLQEANNTTVISFKLVGPSVEALYQLIWIQGYDVVESKVKLTNISNNEIAVEMLSSFSLGMLSPLQKRYKPCSMRVHRIKGRWSQEAHHESFLTEDLLLTPQAMENVAVHSEKFGQLGNKTSGPYHPLVAVEDEENHVLWGAQLSIDGSWQMEVFNKDETISISGGLADYDFGHWLKHLKPGESFEAPSAYLSTCVGDFDDLCYNLTSIQHEAENNYPESEAELPIIYNEWCTTWGNPSRENILRQIELLRGRGIKYFVIDAGWFKNSEHEWYEVTGDWIPSQEKYPDGIKEVADAIRAAGMVPGIWCELETCGHLSEAFQLKEHLLKKNGKQIISGNRKYWDFRDQWTVEYLNHRLVDLLDSAGFGYLKIDSNECCGVGCDGAESLGEGLRQNLTCYEQFVKNMQKRLPELVVENCSSGSMRVTPKMSFIYPIFSGSDAFECTCGPIIYANNHWIALPQQNSVWCTLRAEDSAEKLMFKLSAGFLGRICLSGSIGELTPEQSAIVDLAITDYKKSIEIIKNGKSHRLGAPVRSYTIPSGWQAVVREGTTCQQTMVVFHTFDVDVPDTVEIPLPEDVRSIIWDFRPDKIHCHMQDKKLVVQRLKPNIGCVFMLTK